MAGVSKTGRFRNVPLILVIVSLVLHSGAQAQSTTTASPGTSVVQSHSTAISAPTTSVVQLQSTRTVAPATLVAQTQATRPAPRSSTSSATTRATSSPARKTEAQSSSSRESNVGTDCTRDSAICRRGLLCLPKASKSGGGRVCRVPKKFEMCDAAAPCDSSDPNVTLACRPVVNAFSGALTSYFPGRSCVQLFGRQGRCNSTFDDCLPGLTCSVKGVCRSESPAKAGEDCSQTDCEDGLACKIRKDGSRACANLVAEGQLCDRKEYAAGVNPCQSEPKRLACIQGKCASPLPMGASCTVPDYGGQCGSSPSGAATACVASESGGVKCLIPGTGRCGDSISTGCAGRGMQCIRGYCGIRKGGQGDVCTAGSCRPGLRCVGWPVGGAGSRCAVQQGLGGSCDARMAFAVCGRGLKCGPSSQTCIRPRPVGRGGTCVGRVSECASGLTCVPGDAGGAASAAAAASADALDWEGTCKQVSGVGGVCNAARFEVCDRPESDVAVHERAVGCVGGLCVVGTTVGSWMDRCGAGSDVTCAARDAVGALACDGRACVRVDLTLGQACRWPSRGGGPISGSCAAGLTCRAFGQPGLASRCARLAADGERCDYNRHVGCAGTNASCVVGRCAQA